MSDQPAADPNAISRRRALQAAVGTGVAAAAWNAPRIDGISIRPDYAAAATAIPTSVFGFVVFEGSCNNNNVNLQKDPLPGLTFELNGKINGEGAPFTWVLTGMVAGATNCRVTGMTCSYPPADMLPSAPPAFFAEGASGTGDCISCCSNNSCDVTLTIDVECDVI